LPLPIPKAGGWLARITGRKAGVVPSGSMAPSSSQDRPWGYFALLACIVAGGIYWLFLRSEPVARVEPPPSPAGWDELAACGMMASLDDAKQIRPFEDHHLELWDLPSEGKDETRLAEGTWDYDAASKRYIMTLSGQKASYSLISRGDPVTCILYKGDPGAADLRASWFSFPERDEDAR